MLAYAKRVAMQEKEKPGPHMYLVDTNHGTVTSPVVDFYANWRSVNSLVVDRNVTEPGADSVLATLGAIAG